ncbi:chemotaxis protein CheW [uncultured Sphingomonas sp.]|uniref:chemotaxis protein CheW n=1 Tax=uncultured Sphingomonas sp. TaxID=158754 RepID=UPI0026221CC8|nr:chemotaxis protein CheW [uncultured Sphingomonas sp.]
MSDGELHLIGYLGGRGVLFNAAQVEAVVDVDDVVPAPGAAPAVRGLTALRSRVVTVIDSWRILGLSAPAGGRHRAVITAVDGQLYAVLLDNMEDVAPMEVMPLTSGIAIGDRWAAVAAGSALRDGEPMLVLDLPRLVSCAA